MTAPQKIVRVRRTYNQWVANQTLEDYALRFTAKGARKWSAARVANTAIGAISFLALEAIGGAITLDFGFVNAVTAIVVVAAIIFASSLPITYYAASFGVDIDLLTRGAGFGYIGSTITSLIYASFTYLFFAIEAAIMSLALELCFDVPLTFGYIISSVVVIPLVTHGITFISRLQLWTQPFWIALHLLPFVFIIYHDHQAFAEWTRFEGTSTRDGHGFDLALFGAASTVTFSLIAQIGEQVDFLRFLPKQTNCRGSGWWTALLCAGPGWIVPGTLKLLAGSFLAFLALEHQVPVAKAAEPTQMYLVAFQHVFATPASALAFTGAFVIISQLKINVTNAYAGSIAWSNFFSRLTHSHPGRVVWLVFNVTIALLLMQLGIFRALQHILGLYSIVAVAWVSALVADLVINKPLGLSPAGIEFKRAYLYDINPVGVGAMLLSAGSGVIAYAGLFGSSLQALSAFLTLIVGFLTAPAIALLTRGRFYLARPPREDWAKQSAIKCCICEHRFEPEDMAQCPAYSGPICSLCCTLEARCRDGCKPKLQLSQRIVSALRRVLPAWSLGLLENQVGHYLGVLCLFSAVIGAVLSLVYVQVSLDSDIQRAVLKSTLWTVFFILTIIAGVAAWLFVLAQQSRRVAEEESRRQTELLMREIDAHKRTDAKLQRAKEVAEAASKAKSRYVIGLSHELRSPLNAILGYAQLLERDGDIPPRRIDAIKVVRRSAEHLSGLIDGLLDISKIEAGRFQLDRSEVRIGEFLDQLADMMRLQASVKGLEFRFLAPARLPAAVYTDENRLRQILINLLSNAIKFTEVGHVALRMSYRNQVAEFAIEDTGIGIQADDLKRIFQPFERARSVRARKTVGIGLGLTITRMLTETMGGEITVHSEPGRGSNFRVKLLLLEVAGPRTGPPVEHQVHGYVGPRRTLLTVDDDHVHRDLVRELLVPLGFVVLTAASGGECLKLAHQSRPDLVLLDVSMPDMDGWAVARRLRQMQPRPGIIMISANAADKLREVEPERLHDDYMLKPIEFRQLIDKIHTILDIEWTYQASANIGTNAPRSLIAVPSAEQIDELVELGQIGYVRGIREKLANISCQSSEYQLFVAHMQSIVEMFDWKRYLTELEAFRRNDAG